MQCVDVGDGVAVCRRGKGAGFARYFGPCECVEPRGIVVAAVLTYGFVYAKPTEIDLNLIGRYGAYGYLHGVRRYSVRE